MSLSSLGVRGARSVVSKVLSANRFAAVWLEQRQRWPVVSALQKTNSRPRRTRISWVPRVSIGDPGSNRMKRVRCDFAEETADARDKKSRLRVVRACHGLKGDHRLVTLLADIRRPKAIADREAFTDSDNPPQCSETFRIKFAQQQIGRDGIECFLRPSESALDPCLRLGCKPCIGQRCFADGAFHGFPGYLAQVQHIVTETHSAQTEAIVLRRSRKHGHRKNRQDQCGNE